MLGILEWFPAWEHCHKALKMGLFMPVGHNMVCLKPRTLCGDLQDLWQKQRSVAFPLSDLTSVRTCKCSSFDLIVNVVPLMILVLLPLLSVTPVITLVPWPEVASHSRELRFLSPPPPRKKGFLLLVFEENRMLEKYNSF